MRHYRGLFSELVPSIQYFFDNISPKIFSIEPITLIGGILSTAKSVAGIIKNTKKDNNTTNQGGEAPQGAPQGDTGDQWADVGMQALAAGQNISSMAKQSKAKRLEPSSTDPAQTAMLADISRRRRAFEMGSTASPYLRPIRQAQAQATAGALRAGAGLRGISAAQNVAQKGMLDALGQQQQLGLQLGQQEQDLSSYIAQRKLDLQRVQQTKQEAQAASLGQAGIANLIAQANLGRQETGDGTTTPATDFIKNLNARTGFTGYNPVAPTTPQVGNQTGFGMQPSKLFPNATGFGKTTF